VVVSWKRLGAENPSVLHPRLNGLEELGQVGGNLAGAQE
jgi:hypothetical protein